MKSATYRINLTGKEVSILEQLIRRQTSPQNKVRRAKIILLANEERLSNTQIAKKLSTYKADVSKWTKRWIEQADKPIEDRINDLPRTGSPCRITAEQWCKIMALACESPEVYNVPITHWTHKELAREAVKQKIVSAISSTHLGGFLKK